MRTKTGRQQAGATKTAAGRAAVAPARRARAPRLLQTYADRLEDLIVVLDGEGRVLDINDAALASMRTSRAEVEGHPLWALPQFSSDAATRTLVERAITEAARGARLRFDLDLFLGLADVRRYELSSRRLSQEGDPRTHVLVTGRDVTEERRTRGEDHPPDIEEELGLLRSAVERQRRDLAELAQQLTSRKRELDTTTDAMRVARDQAESGNRAKNNFLGMVSHELRTPLTTIQLQIERFERQRTSLTDPQRGILRTMSTATVRLLQLINSLLEFVRHEGGRLDVRPARFDPTTLAQEIVDELRPRAEAKTLGLALHAAKASSPFHADPRLMRLVVLNLIDNAIKFTDSGRVDLAVAITDGHLRIEVSDTGKGISVDDQERVFLPFEQLEDAHHKHTPGVGLGLALVKGIVEAMGGTLALRSQPGRGTTFVVTVPEFVKSFLKVVESD